MANPRIYPDMWLDPDEDPREKIPLPVPGDERSYLISYLRFQRMTLELKCDGLSPEDLAKRSVEPSNLSLLGLVRHMADVERVWFRYRYAGLDTLQRLFRVEGDRDADFNGAVGTPECVDEAFGLWREECEFADEFIAAAPNLEMTGKHEGYTERSLRGLLLHMIEEYARHLGHADLIRERIDGRTGQ